MYKAVECSRPTLCLRGEARLSVVYQGLNRNPYKAIEPAKARALRAAGYVTLRIHEEDGITVALMIRGSPAVPRAA